jgi:hypothetical protein
MEGRRAMGRCIGFGELAGKCPNQVGQWSLVYCERCESLDTVDKEHSLGDVARRIVEDFDLEGTAYVRLSPETNTLLDELASKLRLQRITALEIAVQELAERTRKRAREDKR